MILASQMSPAAATRGPAASSSDSSLEDSGSKWPPRHNRKEKKRKRGKIAPFKKLNMIWHFYPKTSEYEFYFITSHDLCWMLMCVNPKDIRRNARLLSPNQILKQSSKFCIFIKRWFFTKKLIFATLRGLCPVISIIPVIIRFFQDLFSSRRIWEKTLWCSLIWLWYLGGAEFLDVEAELSGTDASGDESDHGEVEETNLNNPFLHLNKFENW